MGGALRAGGVLGVLVAGLLLLGAGPAGAAPVESISSYDTRIQVDPDGVIRVTETIAYDFGSLSRHGIFRKIPDRFRYDDHRDRVYPITGVNVTMDGRTAQVDRSAQGGYEVLKIGDPGRTVTGSHTYVIRYSVRGALNSFPDHEELYWNVVGGEWTVPITTASATVTGPAAIRQTQCFAGPSGSQLACADKTADGPTATFRQPDLGDGSGLTAVLAFPKGSVRGTGPVLVERHDLATAFRVTPWTVGGAGAMTLLGVGAALAVGWLVGRDRRHVGLLPGLAPGYGESAPEQRRPLTGAPPVSVEFTPPPLDQGGGAPRPSHRGSEVRPGQVGTLIDEQANVLDVTATIVDFAVRRHLHIRELPLATRYGSRDWELTRVGDGDKDFLPYERTLFQALFNGRDQVRLSELKYTFAADLGKVRKQLYADMVAQGWYRQSPARTRAVARGLALLAVLASIGVTVLLGVLTRAALPGLGLVLGAVVLLAVAGRFPARTGKGSAMLARVQGFRLFIATAQAEQIRFEEREQIFSRYLPYAMVFGIADRWASQFAQIGAARPDGTAGLYWYTGQAGWSMLYFHQSIGSFNTVTVGTIASTPPSASGSSGFSGGFSGGGGGGGGGGSW
ncbi:MAG: hypothetical protein V7603_2320 [Micromonosporaceae bacterium]